MITLRPPRAPRRCCRVRDPGGYEWTSRTTVLVTHRLASVRHVDRIIVLEHGRITEDGTHDELMALGGLYTEPYSL